MKKYQWTKTRGVWGLGVRRIKMFVPAIRNEKEYVKGIQWEYYFFSFTLTFYTPKKR